MKNISWLVGCLALCLFVVVAGCGSNKGKKTVVGSKVEVLYSLKANGVQIIPKEKPETLNLTIGKNSYPAELEKALIGLSAGTVKTIRLTPHQAYGNIKPELLARVPKTSLPKGMLLKEGMIISGQRNASGQPTSWRVVKVYDDAVIIDQNHPLAGKTLDYHIELVHVS